MRLRYKILWLSLLGAISLSIADTLTIAAVGDIMMGSTYPAFRLPPDSGRGLFKEAEEILKKADIAFGNLEGPLCDNGSCRKNIGRRLNYAFRTPTYFGINLKNAGFDILNLANNHSLDFGLYGLESTRRTLESLGIKYTDCEGRIGIFDIKTPDTTYLNCTSVDDEMVIFKRKSIKIAFIGFYSGRCSNSLLNIREAREKIDSLSKRYEIVVVSFHGGKEGEDALHIRDGPEYFYGEPRGELIRFAHTVIDAGADLVIGHGPHVPRALEIYKGRLIAYSLGNFCTYKGISVKGICGYAPLLWVNLNEKGEFISGRIYSFKQGFGTGPKRDREEKAFKLMRRLSLEDFPHSSLEFGRGGGLFPKG